MFKDMFDAVELSERAAVSIQRISDAIEGVEQCGNKHICHLSGHEGRPMSLEVEAGLLSIPEDFPVDAVELYKACNGLCLAGASCEVSLLSYVDGQYCSGGHIFPWDAWWSADPIRRHPFDKVVHIPLYALEKPWAYYREGSDDYKFGTFVRANGAEIEEAPEGLTEVMLRELERMIFDLE